MAPKRALPLSAFIAAGIIGGGACGLFVAGPLLARKVVRSTADSTAVAANAKDGAKDGAQPGAAEAAGPVHLIDNLVLNPAGSGGLRFLLATVGVQMKNAATTDALKLREVEARDVVLGVLGTKRVEELAEIKNREAYKQEIKTALEVLFGKGTVKGVYFSQFVVQ
ncbi:MAG: flagellar basal body-associated protein FliL [Gemmatimonadales bacterium]